MGYGHRQHRVFLTNFLGRIEGPVRENWQVIAGRAMANCPIMLEELDWRHIEAEHRLP
jgi:hypothetical protein